MLSLLLQSGSSYKNCGTVLLGASRRPLAVQAEADMDRAEADQDRVEADQARRIAALHGKSAARDKEAADLDREVEEIKQDLAARPGELKTGAGSPGRRAAE